MLGCEYEEFQKNNEQKYIITKNKEILNFIKQKQNERINFILNINEIQRFINEVALFFKFKYPESLLIDILYERCKGTISIKNQCLEIAKSLDIEQLKYRLHNDYIRFLEYPYWHRVNIHKDKKNF